uniref:Cathepsin propeptide inhibitor domain-containing protein n=1 Tax=Lotharella globosa TaxID=91324 RepID=A0A7S3Z5P4_9EUKA
MLQAVALSLCLGLPGAQARWKQAALEADAGKRSSSQLDVKRLMEGTYGFDDYISDFGKKYTDAKELDMRKNIFEESMAEVLKHNSGNYTWKMHINEFSDLTRDEFHERTRGFRLGMHQRHHLDLMNLMEEQGMANLSAKASRVVKSQSCKSADWSSYMSPIKNQGMCGCKSNNPVP